MSIRVDLHLVALTGEEEAALALLDQEERARAAAFRFPEHRRHFVLRRAALRRLVGQAVGREPGSLRFATGPNGKRSLADGGIEFSTSHSGELAAIALSDRPLGLDIESIDEKIEWAPLARRFFTHSETAAIAVATHSSAAFFACWTRKEAFVKAIGRGLYHPLDSFAVSVGEHPALLTGGEGWQLVATPAPPGFCMALVVPSGADTRLRLH